MGLSLFSLAYSFEASSHSFVRVFGGGAAEDAVDQAGDTKRDAMSNSNHDVKSTMRQDVDNMTQRVTVGKRTEDTGAGDDCPGSESHADDCCSDLGCCSGGVDGCPWAMRTKSDVVSCFKGCT